MIGIAFMMDLINLSVEYFTFGVGGILVDALSAAIFTLWMQNYGINLWGDKNTTWTLLTILVDAVPFGDLAFPWTVRVSYAVFTERKENVQEMKATVSGWRL